MIKEKEWIGEEEESFGELEKSFEKLNLVKKIQVDRVKDSYDLRKL